MSLIVVNTIKSIDITHNYPFKLSIKLEIKDADFLSFLNSGSYNLIRMLLDITYHSDGTLENIYVIKSYNKDEYEDNKWSLHKAFKDGIVVSFRSEKDLLKAEKKIIKKIDCTYKREIEIFLNAKRRLLELSSITNNHLKSQC